MQFRLYYRFRLDYKLQLLSFMFKLKNHLLPKVCSPYYILDPKPSHNIRQLAFFKVMSYRTDIRRKSVAIAGPPLWNALPPYLQHTLYYEAFKRELKAQMVNANP